MAALTVQDLPANGVGRQVTLVAANAGGDTFVNTGNEIIYVQYSAGAAAFTVNGVPAPDSGRDGTSSILYYGAGTFAMAGPFKPRNWNTSAGVVEISYPSGATGINIAVVRIPSA